MSRLRDNVVELIKPMPEGKADEFALWAFGEKFLELEDAINFMHAWNELHGDIYRLTGDGCIEFDLAIMVEMWKSES